MRKSLIAVSYCLLLMSCSYLPNSGPSKGNIEVVNKQKSNEDLLAVQLIEVNNKVAESMFNQQQPQSFLQFPSSKAHYQGVVNAGDLLDITLWEAPPATLFGSVLNQAGVSGGQSTHLPEQVVNSNGRITIPFVGVLKVAGKTPEQIQSEIVGRLQAIANQPQAVVRIVKNNSANVTVLTKSTTIRMALTAYGERVLDAIAAAGGAGGNVQDVSVRLTRGNQVQTISLARLTEEPQQNILLRSGDVVTLLNNPLSFTAMGAVGNSKEIRFSAEGLTLAEAIGRLGGLNDDRADPRGVFIFRYVPFEEMPLSKQNEWQAKGYHNGMKIPTVYQANLLEPQSMFWIQQFPIKDKDIVYVSNAPLAEYQKFIRMIFGATTPAVSTVNSVNNL
ncbi:polysaccharide biosynthesis/export family protein [Avibacterium paragallinarum]|uniref:Polysaccharide export protein BexD n=1 Tax=Avibacterium paragallinarum TaxID=728 RepID=A0A377IAR6_AVIPA|nr:polysaccharide biosynthesis/export family protein [Avibacterium paragallinarum]POY46967.1 sugar ABC transporter substrate-binding protein [Avibacterium paragallinarum]RZN77537.1 polysaccharide export protein [Avibacterium paragallinarum]CDG00073.1 Putative GexD protein [Avibacterium paragallinarum JF4211]STO72468.1 polysaccharide export protein BexD [Avibacterium paragallinarum]